MGSVTHASAPSKTQSGQPRPDRRGPGQPQPDQPRVVVVGGGPGGYEAALAAARYGAAVVVVEKKAVGGAAVLTDVVPSKTLIATSEWMHLAADASELGVRLTTEDGHGSVLTGLEPDMGVVNARVLALAQAQSQDVRTRLEDEGVRIVDGHGRLDGPQCVVVTAGTPVDDDGDRGAEDEGDEVERIDADVVLLAPGAVPRQLDTAVPDGERILRWDQIYDLDALPERLIVVGSGVTGAEFASAYRALGADVVLISSRDRLLPGEDADAARVIEDVLTARGMTVLSRCRAGRVRCTADGVEVELTDGQVVTGSHVLMAVGSVPSTQSMGLAEAGVRLGEGGHVVVDRVSRTSVRGVYAAGDCTGVLPLASVAAAQGRIAMAHALGGAVEPLRLETVASTIFTSPEIATVGRSQEWLDANGGRYVTTLQPLATNARAKMLGIRDGFVKLFAHPSAGTVLGGVVVAPRASEMIFPIALAVAHRMTADDVAAIATVYPSLSGSVAEAARRLKVSPEA